MELINIQALYSLKEAIRKNTDFLVEMAELEQRLSPTWKIEIL